MGNTAYSLSSTRGRSTTAVQERTPNDLGVQPLIAMTDTGSGDIVSVDTSVAEVNSLMVEWPS